MVWVIRLELNDLLRPTLRATNRSWSGIGDLNSWPRHPECRALPGCANPRNKKVVWVTGLEPATSTSQKSRATNCATPRYPYYTTLPAKSQDVPHQVVPHRY